MFLEVILLACSLSSEEISKDLISLKTVSNQVMIVCPQQIDLSVLVNAASTSALQRTVDRLMWQVFLHERVHGSLQSRGGGCLKVHATKL
jgi:hypothetical protein